MSKIGKIFQTLRNHWKKSIFFTGLTVWGTHYGYGKYLEFNLMKAYCQEALVMLIMMMIKLIHCFIFCNL